ncbi:MAG: CinA family protein, partial [Erythrobacter sp.]|uniref:CinA family protein n=1 Tax=Erythrobacter sp. TaxID=1042 RepID=UPI003C748862
VPGALDFYVGGGVVYSFTARDRLFGLPQEAYRGMRSVTEEYAILQARAIRDNLGAEWGLAESGSAGRSTHPMGVASGRSMAAVADPSGRTATRLVETGEDDRIANMEAFARNALDLLEEALAVPD